jgi:hypothetical protein
VRKGGIPQMYRAWDFVGLGFRVAQRFTAAVTPPFLNEALAAEGGALAQQPLFPQPLD